MKIGIDIEIRINWTPNQWRRFLGQADMTPLVELTSVATDKVAMLIVNRRLGELTGDLDPLEAQGGDKKARIVASGQGV